MNEEEKKTLKLIEDSLNKKCNGLECKVVKNNIDLRLENIRLKRQIDLMAEEISKSILNTCPLADYNVDLNCENQCKDDYKACWKKYFERKVENGN